MHKIILKHSVRVAALILLLGALFIGALLAWVVTGPREISILTPRIETMLNAPAQNYSVEINNTWLIWDGWKHPLDLRVRDVRLITGSGAVFASFPEISIGFDIPSLLTARLEPRFLVIHRPRIQLFQSPEGELSFGFGHEEDGASLALAAVISQMLQTGNIGGENKLKRLVIDHADLNISSEAEASLVSASEMRLEIRRKKGLFQGKMEINLQYAGAQTSTFTDFTIDPSAKRFITKSVIAEGNMAMLRALLPTMKPEQKLDALVGGVVVLQGGIDGKIDTIDFNINSEDSVFTDARYFEAPITLKKIALKGRADIESQTLSIERGMFDAGGPQLIVQANLSKEPDGMSGHLEATATNLPVDELHRYWPVEVGLEPRAWVLSNIKGGTVPEAKIVMDITPDDAKAAHLPQKAISATVNVHDTSVTYLPGHPPVQHANGMVSFTANTMDIDLTAGAMLTGTILNTGKVHFGDFFAPTTPVRIDLNVTAPANDVATYLALPDLDMAKPLALNPDTIKGSATGDIHIAFGMEEEDRPTKSIFDGVDVSVKTDIKDAAQPGFLGKYSLSGVNGTIEVNNKTLSLQAKGNVNGIPADVTVNHYFVPAEFVTRVTAATTLPATRFHEFGYPDFTFLSGDVEVKGVTTSTTSGEYSEAELTLTQSTIDFPEYGWRKPSGVPATLALIADQPTGKPVNISRFTLEGQNIKAQGTALVASDLATLQQIEFSELRFGNNDITLRYSEENGLHKVALGGTQYDASSMQSGSKGWRRDSVKNIDLKVALGTVLLADGKSIRDLNGVLTCDATRCLGANLTGKVKEGKNFSYVIGRRGNARNLSVNAEDAGAFMDTLGIYNNMQGGTLSLNGAFNDREAGNPLTGTLEISEHTLMQAPVLTKLLTLGSFTGILDTLGGNGITFTKLRMPFVYTGDVVTMKDAKMVGSAMGITADGTLNLATRETQVEGTLVPSYTLNTMVDKIPVVGAALTGGKGEGVFAAQYSIKGMYDAPEISINPLSIVTPGFMRNIFNIFDKPAPPAETTPNLPKEKP